MGASSNFLTIAMLHRNSFSNFCHFCNMQYIDVRHDVSLYVSGSRVRTTPLRTGTSSFSNSTPEVKKKLSLKIECYAIFDIIA